MNSSSSNYRRREGKRLVYKTETQEERQLLHPLERNDPIAFERIKTVRLEFLTEEATAPILRCQDLPERAFGKLTGRSILVSLSHGWFFQMHPDPYGTKLDIIKHVFAPRLRERYPHTDIQVFFDYLASPQRPRTKEEDVIFAIAMDRMNSMYVYADVIIFLEVELLRVDMTIRCADVNLSRYKFFDFVDTVQVSETTSQTAPQQYDCILTCDSNKVDSASELNSLAETHKLTYLHRPFGRPNTIITDDRGWLFLERITIAVKAAASDRKQFENIVISNSKCLVNQIFKWTERLREAASNNNTHALRDVLNHFDSILKTKKFSFSNDEEVVRGLMTKLIHQFCEDWSGEVKKQNVMSKRAREILLRWGSFSENYIERAGFLSSSSSSLPSSSTHMMIPRIILLTFVAPCVATVPFLVNITPSQSMPAQSSALTTMIFATISILIISTIKREFAKIPVGIHSIFDWTYLSVCMFTESFLLRFGFHVYMIPLETLCIVLIQIFIADPIFQDNIRISKKDPRTGEIKSLPLSRYLTLPSQSHFSDKTIADDERASSVVKLIYGFGLLYPLIGSIFFNANVVVQSCLIIVFFGFRATFEYAADSLVSYHFGSDSLPVISFMGVALHEICLSIMITSVKHPLVFMTFVVADIFENVFCLWSLCRVTNYSSSRTSSMVYPTDDDDDDDDDRWKKHQRKSLERRSTSVYKLANEMKDQSPEERKGTALFIVATLLQREFVETMVPIQGICVMTILYIRNIKSNSVTSSWNSCSDYEQALTYMGIDLIVELFIFFGTILVLHYVSPDLSAWRMLCGLFHMHFKSMFAMMIIAWLAGLLLQSFHSGMDTTFQFEWLKCDENATWIGGFHWECP